MYAACRIADAPHAVAAPSPPVDAHQPLFTPHRPAGASARRQRVRHVALLSASEQLGRRSSSTTTTHGATVKECSRDEHAATLQLSSFLAATRRFLDGRLSDGARQAPPHETPLLTPQPPHTHPPLPPPRERRPNSASPYIAATSTPTTTLTPPNVARCFVRRLYTKERATTAGARGVSLSSKPPTHIANASATLTTTTSTQHGTTSRPGRPPCPRAATAGSSPHRNRRSSSSTTTTAATATLARAMPGWDALPSSWGVTPIGKATPLSRADKRGGGACEGTGVDAARAPALHEFESRTRIDTLRTEAAACAMSRRTDSAIALYTRALQLALAGSPTPLIAELCCRRAALYVRTFQFQAALIDCKWALHAMPQHLEANWCAARALLCLNRVAEARRHYQAARRVCPACATCHPFRVDTATERGKEGNGGTASAAIVAEEAALQAVERYARDMRAGLWSRASAAMKTVVHIFDHGDEERAVGRGDDNDEDDDEDKKAAKAAAAAAVVVGPLAAPWRVRQIAAELHMDAAAAMRAAERLHGAHGGLVELYGVMARALFYQAHDAAATRRCLALLQQGRDAIAAQNALLERNVHTYQSALTPDASTAATMSDAELVAGLREWSVHYTACESADCVQLQQGIEDFVASRDAGNAAYAARRWDDAFDAYSRCLHVDLNNYSLLAVTYCNRAAVLMQAERWHEALLDAHKAIRFGPRNDKAYVRRARIYVHLFQGSAPQPQSSYNASAVAAMYELRARYIDAAIADFSAAAALAPSATVQQQLLHAQELRSRLLSSTMRSCCGGAYAAEVGGGRNRAACGAGRRCSDADGAAQTPGVSTQVRQWLDLLGLTPDVTLDERRLAKGYKAAALRWHPDKWAAASEEERVRAERTFKEISVAYNSLKTRLASVVMPAH